MKQIFLLFSSAPLVAALAIMGCGKGAENSSPSRQLLVFSGAGLRPPVAEAIEIFSREHDARITTDYEGSEVMLAKIRLGELGDIYLPGDRHYVEQARKEGLILASATVSYFIPTILVQKGNPRQISSLGDLLKQGVRLGLGNARACAIGPISKEIFSRNGIAWADVERNLAFQSMTVNELGLQVDTGALDAVIVWEAVARYYEKRCEMVPIPLDKNVISTVDIGVLKFTQNRQLADAFVSFITSKKGQAIFSRHGYRVELPDRFEEATKP